MKIGFVSTWFERGAAYVTKSYIDLLKEKNEVFIYARGGESYGKGDPNWDLPNVTWGKKLVGTNINFNHIEKWLKKNKIETLFFNEQHEIEIVYKIKARFPQIKIGSYIDYYKESTVHSFSIYDFLICNTQRHYSVFKHHPQCYYIPWGTNTEVFKPKNIPKREITFFHSVGMSFRKGTKLLLESFIEGELYKNSKLIIHSQIDIKESFGFDKQKLNNYNIEIIEKTVPAPGLYHLGDVYVYPTMLDGLGLTLYEALSCGLPVITSNNAPMNEVINSEVGKLVEIDHFRSRSDGYYWPLSICKKDSLISAMKYYIENKESINNFKSVARKVAIEKWNWKKREVEVNNAFNESSILNRNNVKLPRIKSYKQNFLSNTFLNFMYRYFKKII
jgi:1,2-diacylglycerol 3-alpha-glucosyltransferase